MNNKSCLNCGWWDTFNIPNCCGLTIKQNNPDFKNTKYNIENKKEDFCDQWRLSPFTVYF